MGVTVSGVERAQYAAAIDRLAGSRVLHGSESLCRLLRYLADQSLQNPGSPIKEYQIATEVFGRPSDFDPHVDSSIRVQAGRLRLKLAEYYSSEGERDPILVELPKGSYTLTFHARSVAASTPPVAEQQLEPARKRRRILLNWAAGVVALSILLAAAVAALVVKWQNHLRAEAVSSKHQPVPVAYQTFWKGFVSGPSEPWVVFSNAAFVGRPETGMRYRNPAADSNSLILDHRTHAEVLAVHELDRVCHLLEQEVRVKRGSLFSLDDAKNNDLIFVGSPAENLSLRDIPMIQQFAFQRLMSGPRKGDLAVVNLHAQAGEPPYFIGSPPNVPLSEDYAVVALLRGLDPELSSDSGRHVHDRHTGRRRIRFARGFVVAPPDPPQPRAQHQSETVRGGVASQGRARRSGRIRYRCLASRRREVGYEAGGESWGSSSAALRNSFVDSSFSPFLLRAIAN
jgi:hypothetical protein